MRPISPSQIKAFRLCPRRFTFRYVEGKPDPAGPAAEHGRFIHSQMENWTLRGKRPTHPHAVVMIPHAPRPLAALAERKVEWRGRSGIFAPNDAPWTHLGVLDFTAVLESLATMRTSPFLVPGAPILFGDYKTTSNLKYALEPHQGVLVDRATLEPDPQFLMYADYFLSNGWTDLTGKWIYSRTTGKAHARPVVVRVDNNHVDDAMCGVDNDARAIHQLYKIRPKGNEVPYNLGGCRAFNKPCPHLLYCNLPSRRANFDALSEPDAPEGDNDMGMADLIMSTFPGDPNDEPPVETDDMPDDFGEEGPELPPEEAEDGRGELSDEEQLKVMAEVEKGFVNPPEAPTRAAATPEENFAMHGDPVVEKRKFGKDDKPALLAFAIANGIVEKGSRLAAAGLAKAIAAKGFDPAEVADSGATTVAEVVEREPEDQGALWLTAPHVAEEECGSDEPDFDGPPLSAEEEREFSEPTVEGPVSAGEPVFVATSNAVPTVPDGVLPPDPRYTVADLRAARAPVLHEEMQPQMKDIVEASKRLLEIEQARAKVQHHHKEMIAEAAAGRALEEATSLTIESALTTDVEEAAEIVGATLKTLARKLGARITVSFDAE